MTATRALGHVTQQETGCILPSGDNSSAKKVQEPLISTKSQEKTTTVGINDDMISDALGEVQAEFEFEMPSIDDIDTMYQTKYDDKITQAKKEIEKYSSNSNINLNSADLQTQIDNKEKIESDISKQRENIEMVNAGTYSDLADYSKKVEDTQSHYEEVLSNDPNTAPLKEQVVELNQNINLQQMILDNYTTEIANTEADIEKETGNLSLINSEINSYTNQIANLENAISSCEDDENKAILQSRLSSMQEILGNAKAREITQNNILETLKNKLEQQKTEQEQAQIEQNNLEQQKTELEAQIVNVHNQTITDALEATKNAKEEYTAKKSEYSTQINSELAKLQEQLSQTQEKIKSIKAKLFEEQMKKENALPVKQQPKKIVPQSYPEVQNVTSKKNATSPITSITPKTSQAVELADNTNTANILEDSSKEADEELQSKIDNYKNILSKQDTDLSGLQTISDDAFEKFYEKLSTETEAHQDNPILLSDIRSLKDELSTKEVEIDVLDMDIVGYESILNNTCREYSSTMLNLDALNSQLSNLENMSPKDETMIDAIKEKIDELETSKLALEKEIQEKNEFLDNLKEERTEKKRDYDNIFNELQSKINKACSEYDVSSLATEYNESMLEYTSSKDEKITNIKNEITTSQIKANELYNANEAMTAKNNAKEYSSISNVLDFAYSFMGCNEADGSANKFVNGGSSKQTPWCAAFVAYVMKNSPEADNVASWYKNIDNKWSCNNVYNNAKSANALVDRKDVKVGDLVLFDWQSDGKKDHIGIVTGIDEDGTVHTIEGNTSDKVAERKYNPNKTNLAFARVYN